MAHGVCVAERSCTKGACRRGWMHAGGGMHMDVHVVAAARSKPVASAPASVGKPVASAGKRAKARVHVGECARGG